jgi:hypothetical protein
MKFKDLHFADDAEIQLVVIDELKRFPKQEFSADFRKSTTALKPAYMPM